MAAKIDPVETVYSTGTSLIGRILLFFSAGWVGLLLGRVARAFDDWEDFLHPGSVFGRVFGGLEEELLAMALWPFVALYLTASAHLGLFFLVLIGSAVVFFVLVWTEEPAPLWWLILVAVTSLVPVFGTEDRMAWPAVAVLAVFWIGLGAVGWWVLRAYHPEVVEVVADVVHGRIGKDRPDKGPPPTPRRKAPPGTWPKGVAGFEGDDDAAETGTGDDAEDP